MEMQIIALMVTFLNIALPVPVIVSNFAMYYSHTQVSNV